MTKSPELAALLAESGRNSRNTADNMTPSAIEGNVGDVSVCGPLLNNRAQNPAESSNLAFRPAGDWQQQQYWVLVLVQVFVVCVVHNSTIVAC